MINSLPFPKGGAREGQEVTTPDLPEGKKQGWASGHFWGEGKQRASGDNLLASWPFMKGGERGGRTVTTP